MVKTQAESESSEVWDEAIRVNEAARYSADVAYDEDFISYEKPSVWRFVLLLVAIVVAAAFLVFVFLPYLEQAMNPPPPPALQPPLRL